MKIIFNFEARPICIYDVDGTTRDEIQATRELLAYERGTTPDMITVEVKG